MFYFALVILFAAGVALGTIKQRQEVAWGQPFLVTSSALLLVLVLWKLFLAGPSGPGPARQLGLNHLAYAEAAGEKLGRHLAEKDAGEQALVILPLPYRLSDGENQALLRGLERGLDGRVEIIERHQLPMPAPYLHPGRAVTSGTLERQPVDSLFTGEHFDSLVQQYAGRCSLIISLAGGPSSGAMDMDLWRQPGRPRIAVFADRYERIKELVEAGRIDVAVYPKKMADLSIRPAPDDLDEAFDRRYELRTAPPR